jgi:hypothetical protein
MTFAAKTPRILVVDDDEHVRIALAELLREEEFEVSTAESGEEALKRILQKEFDLALVDVQMPGMNGLELLKKLKESQPAIDVIMITAYATLDVAIQALRLGAYDFICKPSENEEILASIKRCLEKRRLSREIEKTKERLSAVFKSVENSITVINPDYIIVEANPATCALLGREIGEIVGKPCYEINHGLKMPCPPEWGCSVRDVMKKKRPVRFVHEHLTKKGEKRFVEITASPIKDEKGRVIQIVEVMRDITEEVYLERETELLLKVNNLLNAGAPEDEIFGLITTGLTSLFGYKLSAILLLDREKNSLIVKSYSFDSNIVKKIEQITGIKAIGYKVPILEKSFVEVVTKKKKAVITNNIVELIKEHTDNRKIKNLAPVIAKLIGISYGIGVPLVAGDKLVGTIGVGSEHELTQRDAERLERFGRQAGLAVERAMLIEDLERAYNRIKRYAAELEHSNRLKELFMDIMCHDLITPACSIRELAKMLACESPGNEELMLMVRCAEKLVEMIENANKLSKLESKSELQKAPLDLREVVKKAVEATQPLMESAGMKVENRITKSMPVIANHMIEDVFLNLLSNAAKYAADGKRVVIDAVREDESIKVLVKDYGPGIPDEHKDGIFQRFTRKDKRGVKGSGLGLAIVKRIVELHNGKVWVEDNPEGGSIFYVQLPKGGDYEFDS